MEHSFEIDRMPAACRVVEFAFRVEIGTYIQSVHLPRCQLSLNASFHHGRWVAQSNYSICGRKLSPHSLILSNKHPIIHFLTHLYSLDAGAATTKFPGPESPFDPSLNTTAALVIASTSRSTTLVRNTTRDPPSSDHISTRSVSPGNT